MFKVLTMFLTFSAGGGRRRRSSDMSIKLLCLADQSTIGKYTSRGACALSPRRRSLTSLLHLRSQPRPLLASKPQTPAGSLPSQLGGFKDAVPRASVSPGHPQATSSASSPFLQYHKPRLAQLRRLNLVVRASCLRLHCGPSTSQPKTAA